MRAAVTRAAVIALACAACEASAPGAAIVVPTVESITPPAVPLPLASSPPPRPVRSAIVGGWEGTGTQTSGDTWRMIVDITSVEPGACGTARYPSLGCTARWVCERFEGDELVAIEELTTGAGRCIDRGRMRMHLVPNDSLEWSWEGTAGEEERASAVLVRRNAQ